MSEPMTPGMRFLTIDAELVRVYLRQKLIVRSLPHGFQKLFLDVTLYQHNPQDLVAMHEQLEEDQEDAKKPQVPELARAGEDNRQRILEDCWKRYADSGEQRPGHRVQEGFGFLRGRHSGGVKTEWKMHEY
ncbi:hypothetical protein Sango_1577400 [Sesamum angolense]|uniref:NAC domain-containing protein n=1 Tax=Sesamum angolense TaxID=2727404 RepID=A0AAE1WQI7_9LAMI|nr:hypothetical protein Sango_1577400 [Sesamum angolense]